MLLWISSLTPLGQIRPTWENVLNEIGSVVEIGPVYAKTSVTNVDEEGYYRCLTLTTLWANSAGDKLVIFFLFSQKIGFNNTCSPIFLKKKKMKKIF